MDGSVIRLLRGGAIALAAWLIVLLFFFSGLGLIAKTRLAVLLLLGACLRHMDARTCAGRRRTRRNGGRRLGGNMEGRL